MASSRDDDYWPFIARLLILAAFILLFTLLWALRGLLILVVGAVVFAVLLRVLADPLMRLTGLGTRASALLAVLIILALLGLLGWTFGGQIVGQFNQLGTAIPDAWGNLARQIATLPMGEELLASMNAMLSDHDSIANWIGRALLALGDALTAMLLVFFGAIFIAAQPRLYRQGMLKLLPSESRPLAGEAMDDAGRALKLWLLGQLISMVVVGVLSGVGLWLAGVPSALALGIIAGLTEGVPYLGPIAAAIPGLLLALLQGPETALWALLVYVIVQQVEGNTLVPIVQRQTVSLPPALTLFAIIAAGMLFGLVGVIFAAPLLVIVFVLVKRLYVRESLGTPTPIPGERTDEG